MPECIMDIQIVFGFVLSSSGLFSRRVFTSIIARWDGFVTSQVTPTLGRLEALRNSSEESKIIEYHIDNFVHVVALTKQRGSIRS